MVLLVTGRYTCPPCVGICCTPVESPGSLSTDSVMPYGYTCCHNYIDWTGSLKPQRKDNQLRLVCPCIMSPLFEGGWAKWTNLHFETESQLKAKYTFGFWNYLIVLINNENNM